MYDFSFKATVRNSTVWQRDLESAFDSFLSSMEGYSATCVRVYI